VGWEKVAFWSTKVTISETGKDRGKVTMGTYRNAPTLFRTVPSPTPYGLIFPKIVGSQPPPKTPIAISSGTGETTDFRFGWNIHRVHPNKSPLQISEKRERRRIQGLPNFGYPQLSQELVKLRTSNFVRIFMASVGRRGC